MSKLILTLFSLILMFQVQAAEIKVASVSFHSKELAYNLPKMAEISEAAAKNGARLIVFPEMSSTGFLYSSFAEAKPNMDTFPGKSTEAFGRVAHKHNIYCLRLH